MADTVLTINCPKCQAVIPLDEALRAKVLADENAQHERALEEFRTASDAKLKEVSKAAATQVEEAGKAAAALAWQQASQEFETRETALTTALEAERTRTAKLLGLATELTAKNRNLEHKDQERDLEYQKKFTGEEQRIRTAAREEAAEEHRLKDAEKDERLRQAREQVETLKRKIEQGSQQTQGDVLEVALEDRLRNACPDDDIVKVKQGQRGADVKQHLKSRHGHPFGTILWEGKHANWSHEWLAKLRGDKREAKADFAVLVAVQPPGVEIFAEMEGVWVVQWRYVELLEMMLRGRLIAVAAERASQAAGDNEKERTSQYVHSLGFRHRIEAQAEGLAYLVQELDREKRWFHPKWARQEREIHKIRDSLLGMYGDLQAVTGRSLTAIPALEPIDPAELTGGPIIYIS